MLRQAAVLVVFVLLSAQARAGQIEDGETALKSHDYQTALKILQPLADQGNANAQVILGRLYEHYQGRTVYDEDDTGPWNIIESRKWFLKAALQGNAEAEAALGKFYYHQLGVRRDYTEAAKWFRKAADQGNPLGDLYLGAMYTRGEGVEKDDAEAYFWYSLSEAYSKLKQPQQNSTQVALRLTSEQKSAVDKRVADWLKAHPVPAPATNPPSHVAYPIGPINGEIQ
jgi:hypothetical protein